MLYAGSREIGIDTVDTDNDLISDDSDNCPNTFNSCQFDADSDGDMDLAVANEGNNTISLLFNNPRMDITSVTPAQNASKA